MKQELINISKKHFLKHAWKAVSTYVVQHRGAFLTGTSIVLNLSGIAVTYRNSPKIHEIIDQCKRNISCLDPNMELYEDYKKQYFKEALLKVIPLVSPIIIFFGLSTAASIVNEKKNEATIATLSAALSVAQSSISEYSLFKEEAKEALGEEKFNEIQNKVVEEKIDQIPVSSYENVHIKPGEELCCIPDFNIFFSGTEQTMRFAMDRANGLLASDGRDGRSYGHTKYGHEVLTMADILEELSDPTNIEIPPATTRIEWNAGDCDYIFYQIGSGKTRSGKPYLTLLLDYDGSSLNPDRYNRD